MINRCQLQYIQAIDSRKKYGIFKPNVCSDYKVSEGIKYVRFCFYHFILQLIENSKYKCHTNYAYGPIIGEEFSYVQEMPERIAYTLGREFTSAFENLHYCNWITSESIRKINEVYPIRLAHLATFDLEKVRKKLTKIPERVFFFELENDLDSTGLVRAVRLTNTIASEIENLMEIKKSQNS